MTASTIEQTIVGVTRRTVHGEERPLDTQETQLPLVIEAGADRSVDHACQVLADNTPQIMADIHEHGAVLLRGFDINTAQDYEMVATSIRGLQPMTDYFMSEPGRKTVPGTAAVFNTNSIARTGGGFVCGLFHSENYHSPEVPEYISFCPLSQPWFGSETCLVNGAEVFEELPPKLQQKLLEQPCTATIWPLPTVAQQHGQTLEEAEAHCKEMGLQLLDKDGTRFVVLNKPSIYTHPVNGRKSMQVNLYTMFRSFKGKIMGQFNPTLYRGPKWWLHRFIWALNLEQLMMPIMAVPRLLLQPKEAKKFLGHIAPPKDERADEANVKPVNKQDEGVITNIAKFLKFENPAKALGLTTITDVITDKELDALCESIYKHSSLFTWQKGDILIADNYQLLHSGMPGLGPRDVHAMFFNKITVCG